MPRPVRLRDVREETVRTSWEQTGYMRWGERRDATPRATTRCSPGALTNWATPILDRHVVRRHVVRRHGGRPRHQWMLEGRPRPRPRRPPAEPRPRPGSARKRPRRRHRQGLSPCTSGDSFRVATPTRTGRRMESRGGGEGPVPWAVHHSFRVRRFCDPWNRKRA